MSAEPITTKKRSPERSLGYWIPRILIAAALLAFLGYFLVYVNYAWQLFKFPFDYDQGEGFELMDTLLFSQGEWPYRDNNSFPFYSSNYPPFFTSLPFHWCGFLDRNTGQDDWFHFWGH